VLLNKLKLGLVLVVVFAVYRVWFRLGTLSAGDWPYLYLENIGEFSWFPEIRFLWLGLYYQIPAKLFVQVLGLSWEVVERVIWFVPFVLLCVYSSYRLTKSWLGVLVYTTSTYILMVVGGGQMGVAFGYALAPLVLDWFVRGRKGLLGGLFVSLQLMFDPRMAYITLFGVVLYYLVTDWKKVRLIIIPLIIAFILNLFWIVPIIMSGTGEYGDIYTGGEMVEFFSFAKFENAISLFHPNWPDNIFGKVGFQRPEFMLLPILAFSSLLFSKKPKILFFALLGLVGSFLAKGANEPFGMVYLWLFEHVPGFVMFRDPTKWYLLIALSYSVLIPYVLNSFKVKWVVWLFIVYWVILIRPVWLGQLTGTFEPKAVPGEYIELKDFIYEQDGDFKTLWIPGRQRFGFVSKNHPAIEASSSAELSRSELLNKKVKYIIVPYDNREELFIEDHKYVPALRAELIEELGQLSWLEHSQIENIDIFEIKADK